MVDRALLRSPQMWAAAVLLCLLGLVPVYAQVFEQPFYITLFARILIFAIAALGLNLILGYGAMVSFGHALYIGIGAYAVGILSFHGVTSGWAHLLAGLAVGAVAAIIVGWVCLRTTGIAFIMITLAFAQMFYFLGGQPEALRRRRRPDDCRAQRFRLGESGQQHRVLLRDLRRARAPFFSFRRIVDSRFGMVLRGCKSNERRMAALGFPTVRYKLVAYVISALVCVVAGMMLANLTRFASPSFMQWQASGDLIVMIVLGGMGTLIGPIAGATGLLLLEEVLSGWTQHWMVILGPLIVLIVIVSNRGIFGVLAALGGPRVGGRDGKSGDAR